MSDCRLEPQLCEAFRRNLDRPPSYKAEWAWANAPWRAWFDGDVYLGERSGRVGPDVVDTAQKCTCPVCSGSIE